ncbi:hypothetical protein CBE37_01910 [bacterium TMED277]|nr:MAG: hypothetical protein CBE37_01910 [bacterium TMED277]
MRFLFIIIVLCLFNLKVNSKNLEKCEWKNVSGKPCLTIFSAPNTSKINEQTLGKTIITKKQMIESGHQDVRSLLEHVVGVDVYSDGPRGQKTSIFMRGTNSNHTLVLLNGIPINDQSSPKAMFDFGYDFLQGLQQIEIYKGASGAIFGPAAIGGAINFVTDINYENYISLSGSDSRTNSISGNYTYLTDNDWHHNIQAGSSQIEELSTQNSSKDLDGTKNLSLNYNSMKFLSDNTKLKFTGYTRKTDSGYDSWDDANANADNIMYAFQTSIENKNKDFEDNVTAHVHVHDRYYDTAVKNKYYSQSYTIKGERKLNLSDSISLGFGSDYNYNKGDFQVKGNWGSSAKGHSDNLGIYSNLGYEINNNTILSGHLRGDSHKYSEENLTYRVNLTKLINSFTLSLSESTGLRHPDLYVLHGTNPTNSFKAMNTTKPETSFTRELSAKYNFSENLSLESTAYKGSVSDVLNRGTSTFGYNEIIDIEQEGLENSLVFKNQNQKIALTSTFSKSREDDGSPQLRRPEKQFGVNYSKNFVTKVLGPFSLNYDYKHVGKVEDWKNGSIRAKVDSSDIMNLNLSKNFFGSIWSVHILNLTDEKYQRPDTYNQEDRRIELSFRHKY